MQLLKDMYNKFEFKEDQPLKEEEFQRLVKELDETKDQQVVAKIFGEGNSNQGLS